VAHEAGIAVGLKAATMGTDGYDATLEWFKVQPEVEHEVETGPKTDTKTNSSPMTEVKIQGWLCNYALYRSSCDFTYMTSECIQDCTIWIPVTMTCWVSLTVIIISESAGSMRYDYSSVWIVRRERATAKT
jgi:hypothetical protein